MYQITELPAWDSKGEPRLLSTKCTSVRLFEEKGRLKISSNYPTGNNISLYLSAQALDEFFRRKLMDIPDIFSQLSLTDWLLWGLTILSLIDEC